MKRLVLAGAGHAHARVLLECVQNRIANVEIVLVSPVAQAPYSGMVPGGLAGHYQWQECCVDFARLCERAGARLHVASVAGADLQRCELTLDDGERLAYDWLSLDIGSTLQPPASKQVNVLPMRPLATLNLRWEALLQQVRRLPEGDRYRVLMIGGGAAGVESMLSAHARLTQVAPKIRFDFTLATARDEIVPGMAKGAARRLRRHLSQRDIALLHDFSATHIDGDAVIDAAGRRLPAEVALWATGAQAHAWPEQAGLAVDARGFVRIDDTLRVTGTENVFASGDCASWHPPLPKAGVYAVRMGPVLAHNLRATIEGAPPQHYEPQRRYLVLIGTGDTHAVAAWGPLSWQGDWVWRWKESIDRRFLARNNAV